MTEFPPAVVTLINDRSRKLHDEFAEHFEAVADDLRKENAATLEREGGIDRHRIFEGWAVQKIASLQILVEDLWALNHQ